MNRIYTIHRLPGGDGEEAAFIREAFSFWAFLFGPFWFLFHRLWLVALALLAAELALSGLMYAVGLTEVFQSVVQIAVAVLIGLFANDIRRFWLERQGYVMDGVVAANDLAMAEELYFARQPDVSSDPPQAAPMPVTDHPPPRQTLSPFAPTGLSS